MSRLSRIYTYFLRLSLIAAVTMVITLPAYANEWQILPGESVQSLAHKTGARVINGSVSRLDPGLVMFITYLQDSGMTRNDVYRCIEYVMEFDFKLVRSACFWGAVPGVSAPEFK